MNIEDAFGIVQIPLPTPFPVGPVNTFLIKGDAPILVDTGLNTDESYDLLVKAMAEHGLVLGDLAAIFITHGHRDHMGSMGRILREVDVASYGHPLVRKLGREVDKAPEKRKTFFIGILDEFGVPSEALNEANSLYDRFRAFSEPYELSHCLEDGDEALGHTAYHVPGHAPSDTLIVHLERGYSFAGDHILENTNPNPLLRRPAAGQPRAKCLVEYQASLRRSLTLELGVCLPGHGGPIEDPKGAVRRILERQEKRSGQVLKFVRDGHETPYQVSRKLFPDLPAQHIHLGLSIAVGHMEVLEEADQLNSYHEGSVLHFAAS